MSYYKGCELTIEIPETGSYDQAAIKKALTDELPGIEIVVRTGHALHAANAVVPKEHPLGGASEQKGRGPEVHTGGRSLLTMAEEVLDRFKSSSQTKKQQRPSSKPRPHSSPRL
jgi:hypothetical protein